MPYRHHRVDWTKITYFKITIFAFTSCFISKSIETVNMKIVEEPSSYGLNSYNFATHNNDDRKLKMRITPSNFSGPAHLRRLYGKCFSNELEVYKYEFCPFFNVTQHEQSYRWNPFSGVLGVWQEWEINNNTFTAMHMREGEKCGNIYRTVKVIFICGEKHNIINVTEPSTCNYHMHFSSPYLCHRDSMLVYPTLTKEAQEAWDVVEGELFREEITQKGYKKQLQKIFENAGFYLPQEKQKLISEQAVEKEKIEEKEEKGEFETLTKCTEEYQKLKKELEGLRTTLALNNKDKDTTKNITKSEKKRTNKGGKSVRKKSQKFFNLITTKEKRLDKKT